MEELKLILQTLSTMGEAAKSAFIWWVVLDKLVPTIVWASCMGGTVFGAYKLLNNIGAGNLEAEKIRATKSFAIAAIMQIRRELGILEYKSIGKDVSPSGLEESHIQAAVKAVCDLKKNGG